VKRGCGRGAAIFRTAHDTPITFKLTCSMSAALRRCRRRSWVSHRGRGEGRGEGGEQGQRQQKQNQVQIQIQYQDQEETEERQAF
jgi:hypothetical protein